MNAQPLTPEGERIAGDLAGRHGFSVDAVTHMPDKAREIYQILAPTQYAFFTKCATAQSLLETGFPHRWQEWLITDKQVKAVGLLGSWYSYGDGTGRGRRRLRFSPFVWIGCLKKAKEFVREQATENVARQPQPYRMEDKAGKPRDLSAQALKKRPARLCRQTKEMEPRMARI
jgi:hypothetical protein